eukprot:jgi/Botrbrau1/3506/Bobra.341_2s0035.1
MRCSSIMVLVSLFLSGFCPQAFALGPMEAPVGVLTPLQNIGLSGSCGYDFLDPTVWPYGAIASISSMHPLIVGLPSGGCGSCIQINCLAEEACNKAPPVIVTVVDVVSEKDRSLNVPVPSIAALANAVHGSRNFELQQVDCKPPGNIQLRISRFQSGEDDYIRLAPFAVAGTAPVVMVDIKSSSKPDPAFVPLERVSGGTFASHNVPELPLDVRLTNSIGQQVIARKIVEFPVPGVLKTDVQFVPPMAG